MLKSRVSVWLLFLIPGFILCLAGTRSSHADTVTTFVLYNVTFQDGSKAYGTYNYDFTTHKLASANITAGGTYFNNSKSAPVHASTTSLSAVIDGNTVYDFEVILDNSLTPTTGSVITLDPSSSFIQIDTSELPGGSLKTLAITGGSILPTSSLPGTTAALSGPAGANGWYTGPVTTTLTTRTAGHPITATYYTLDGGATQTYTAPFVISAPGTHTLNFWSVDSAGFVGVVTKKTIKINATPPVTTASILAGVLTLTATDATSGVASTIYTLDGGAKTTYKAPITSPVIGTHTVFFWSVNFAGNTEAQQTISLVVPDTTPPTAPTNLSVTLITTTSIGLAWTASADNVGVVSYGIYETTGHSGRGGGYTTREVASSTTNICTVGGLTAGSYHNYTAYAFDAVGNKSGASNEIFVQAGMVPSISHGACRRRSRTARSDRIRIRGSRRARLGIHAVLSVHYGQSRAGADSQERPVRHDGQ